MKYSLLVMLMVLGSVAFAHADLTRTLKVGMRGDDVRELQVFLNSDPGTKIAESGVGSPGYESTYFGIRTAQAVNRFQAKYAIDVLTPAGLLYPTGVVGALTRQKIAQLRPLSPVVSTPTTSSIPHTLPRIDSIMPSIVTRDAQSVTLKGSFDPSGNTVLLSSESKDGVYSTTSPDGTTITFSFSSSLARKLAQQISTSPNRARSIAAFVQNLNGPEIERRNGVTYSRVILIVRNSYGESIPQTLYVDLASVLNS